MANIFSGFLNIFCRYREPCHPRCRGLMLLETYTTLSPEDFSDRLPSFLNVDQQVQIMI